MRRGRIIHAGPCGRRRGRIIGAGPAIREEEE
jgi:hypothetical protein